jgi:hypothetical protein
MSRRNQNKQIVWHYTYSSNIGSILRRSVLLPPCMTPGSAVVEQQVRNAGLDPNSNAHKADASLLLFSQREDWEPASFRGYRTWYGSTIDLLELEDYEEHGIQVYRIGVPRSLLHPWVRLKEMSKMPTGMGRELEKIARDIGSNPFDWFGTTRPVPRDKWAAIEIYNPGTETWEAFPPPGVVVKDKNDNILAGREVLEGIVATGMEKDVAFMTV